MIIAMSKYVGKKTRTHGITHQQHLGLKNWFVALPLPTRQQAQGWSSFSQVCLKYFKNVKQFRSVTKFNNIRFWLSRDWHCWDLFFFVGKVRKIQPKKLDYWNTRRASELRKSESKCIYWIFNASIPKKQGMWAYKRRKLHMAFLQAAKSDLEIWWMQQHKHASTLAFKS